MERRIDHVVVLMLENRSFDHLLGFHQHTGFPTIEPELYHVPDRLGGGSTRTFRPEATADGQVWRDPPHSHLSAVRQIDDGRMDGEVVPVVVEVEVAVPRLRPAVW